MIIYCSLRGCHKLVSGRSKTQILSTTFIFCSRDHYRAYLGSREAICERFWKRVIFGTYINDCWLWAGGTNGTYGSFAFTLNGRRVQTSSHRFSWVYYYGRIPNGLQVCHNCPTGDNPLCVNSTHLFLGTQYENIQDMIIKGRKRWSSKLTDCDVKELMSLRASGWTYIRLAKRFDISIAQVGHISNGEMWKHITEKKTFDNKVIRRNNQRLSQRGSLSHLSRLTEENISTIFQLRSEGRTHRQIGEYLNISRSHVGNIVRGDRWAHMQEVNVV